MLDFDLMESQALATAALYRFLGKARGTGGIILVARILNDCATSSVCDSDSIKETARNIQAILNDTVKPEEDAKIRSIAH